MLTLHYPSDLKNARILIANDDGIHSQGIKVLERAAATVCDNVYVCAPENEQSAAGHSLTIHSPLRVRQYDDRHMSVYGTPTDSVLVGVQKFMKDKRPTLVLSGVNHGQNTGDDITYSGTVSAAIESTMLGIPSIAFSQYYNDEQGQPNWDMVERMIPKILQKIAGLALPHSTLLNVNFPILPFTSQDPAIRVVRQGHFTYDKAAQNELVELIDPRGRPYFWIGPPALKHELDPDLDVGAVVNGAVTITPLNLNLTHEESMAQLGELFA